MRPLLNMDFNVNLIDFHRIDRLRAKMLRHDASLCSERALFYTQSFRTTINQPMILRKAQAFAYTLKNMHIYVEEDSLFFGNQASRNFAAPIYPEYSIAWIKQEIDSFPLRKGDAFSVDPIVRADLFSIFDDWKGITHQDKVLADLSEDVLLAQKQGALHLGGISMSGDGHLVPDFTLILKLGFRNILATLPNDTDFYRSVRIALEAALDFAKRYADVCLDLAHQCDHLLRKQELLDMSKRANRLFEGPASSYLDGIQTMYLVHILQSIESNGHSFCFGRFDQEMYPLYQQDITNGVLSREQALEATIHFFLMTNSLNKLRPNSHTTYSQGYPLYTNLMIGGVDENGIDATNDLSYLCMEAMNQTALNEPNFSMRYHQKDLRAATTSTTSRFVG